MAAQAALKSVTAARSPVTSSVEQAAQAQGLAELGLGRGMLRIASRHAVAGPRQQFDRQVDLAWIGMPGCGDRLFQQQGAENPGRGGLVDAGPLLG